MTAEPIVGDPTEETGEPDPATLRRALDERITRLRAELDGPTDRDPDAELELAQLIGERSETWVEDGDRDRAVDDLREERELLRGVIAAADTGFFDVPDLSARLFLGLCCAQLDELTGDAEHGDEAITALRVVVPLLAVTNSVDAAWFGRLLAELLFDRCAAGDDGSELARLRRLSEAAALADMAVRECPADDPGLLADALLLRAMVAVPLWACDDTSDDDDAGRAALRTLLSDTLRDLPAQHRRRWILSSDLAELCHEDYWTSNDPSELDLAVDLWAATLDDVRLIGTVPSYFLGEYASTLESRFRVRKEVDPEAATPDRDRAIELFEESFGIADEDDPRTDWFAWCGALYFDRFAVREDELDDDSPDPAVLADLDAAVRWLSSGVEDSSPDLPWYPLTLRLAAAAQVRQLPFAEPPVDTVDRVIAVAEQAMAVTDDEERLAQTRILAGALTHRFDATMDQRSLLPALDVLGAEYARTERDHPDRLAAAMALVNITNRAHHCGLVDDATAERTGQLLDEWDDTTLAGVSTDVRVARVARQLATVSTGGRPDWRQPSAGLRRLARDLPRRRSRWQTVAGTALLTRFCDGGRVRDLAVAAGHLRATMDRATPGTIQHTEQALLLAYTSAVGLLRGWVPKGTTIADAAAELDVTLTGLMATLPADSHLRLTGTVIKGMAKSVAAGRNPTYEQTVEMLDLFRRLPTLAGGNLLQPYQRMMVALTATTDPRVTLAEVHAAVAELRNLVDEGMTAPRATFYPQALATALVNLYSRDRDPAHLDEAVGLFRTALAATAPGSWTRTDTAGQLATALRRLADHDRAYEGPSRTAGIEWLSGYAQLALIQSDPAEAAAIMRDAGPNAATTVAWCVSDRAWGDAVRAMESGRALTLAATMTLGTVAERLRDAGHHDLADEWDAAEDESLDDLMPSDLPSRAVVALDAAATAPPEPGEIVAALRALGQDALVYLVPGDPQRFGYAVFVWPDGAVTGTTLPKLVDTPGGDVHHFHQVYDAMRAATDPDERDRLRRRWTAALDGLLPWAWSAAMEVVLSTVGRGTTLPRITLIPVGQLSGVPWHAAHSRYPDRTLGRPTYAIDRAVISYAAAARILVDSAERPAMPLDGSALLIGNPAGADNLEWAEKEATALWRAFYPDADYFGAVADLGDGRAPDRPRRECSHTDLLAGLPGGTRCRPVVHLSCHAGLPGGSPAGSVLGARLVLGPGGLALSVAKILRQATGRPRGNPGPLVDLAGCNTHLTGQVHDEALTLATAFLVAGAATVLGSQWRVLDRRTALLMFVVHHHLRVGGLPPAEALRAAQLWMLDPARQPVATMPPLLREAVRATDLTQPRGWAAFVHQGR